MAFVWLDAEGAGVPVQETAAEVCRLLEEDPEQMFVELLFDGGENDFHSIYVDKASVVAVEVGRGHEVEEAE
jgi:hypothetical protein